MNEWIGKCSHKFHFLQMYKQWVNDCICVWKIITFLHQGSFCTQLYTSLSSFFSFNSYILFFLHTLILFWSIHYLFHSKIIHTLFSFLPSFTNTNCIHTYTHIQVYYAIHTYIHTLSPSTSTDPISSMSPPSPHPHTSYWSLTSVPLTPPTRT